MAIQPEDPVEVHHRPTDGYHVCVYADGAEVHIRDADIQRERDGGWLASSIKAAADTIKARLDAAEIQTALIGERQRSAVARDPAEYRDGLRGRAGAR